MADMSRTRGHDRALPLSVLSPNAPDDDDYERLDEIGTGAYGTVYRAVNRRSGKHVALKELRLLSQEEGVPVTTVREVTLLKRLGNIGHPNVVKLFSVILKEGSKAREYNIRLVFEYLDRDLAQFMRDELLIPKELVKNIVLQLLKGLDFLHSNRVVHRDLKPQNVLVARDGVVKIADFGLARLYHSENMRLTSVVVTLWYRAPEVMLVGSYDTSVDIWSLGCIWAELLRRRPLFDGKHEGEQLALIFRVIGTPEADEWPAESAIPCSSFEPYAKQDFPTLSIPHNVADIIEEMLKFNPDHRLKAQEALQLPYFMS
eukprot:m.4373 g.4373  ORF g.4373 m.4373 type:complete len:316 (+) comp10621_c0_seq1:267-1214(+)